MRWGTKEQAKLKYSALCLIALLWAKVMLAPSIISLEQLFMKVSLKPEQQEKLNHGPTVIHI